MPADLATALADAVTAKPNNKQIEETPQNVTDRVKWRLPFTLRTETRHIGRPKTGAGDRCSIPAAFPRSGTQQDN